MTTLAKRSTAGAMLGKLCAQSRQRDRFITREFGYPCLDRGERRGVRQDLRCFLEGSVFVDRDQHGSRLAVTSYEHVVSTVGNVAQELTEVGPELANRDSLRARMWSTSPVPARVAMIG
jgi:hypothetical protein